MTMDATAIGGVSSAIIIIICIYIPLVAFHGVRYYSQSDHIIYIKRCAYIVLYEVLLSIAKCTIICVAFIFALIFKGHIDYVITVWNILNSILTLCLFYCWVWRFWNLHYHLQWTHNALHNQWKSILNKNHFDYRSSSSKNRANSHWYIENKKRYGNGAWCKKHVILPLLLISIIIVVAQAAVVAYYVFYNDNHDKYYRNINYLTLFILLLFFVLPYILLLSIYFKTKVIEDNFYICLELKLILIFLAFQYLFYIAYYFMYYRLQTEPMLLITSLSSILMFGAEVCSVLVATYWVNKKVKLIINNQQFHLRKLIYDTSLVKKKQNSDLLSIEFSVNSSFENESKRRLTERHSLLKSFDRMAETQMAHCHGTIGSFHMNLIQILNNDYAFKIYAKFLLYELSLENMIFFIEIVQYKQCIYNKFMRPRNSQYSHDLFLSPRHDAYVDENSQSKQVGLHDNELFRLIEFCDSIPVSSIVCEITNGTNADYEYNIKLAARELYHKYVNKHAELQINVSYMTRRVLDKIFDTKNDGRVLNRVYLEKNSKNSLEALLGLFDGCVREVTSLMMDSYQRIETSSHYRKLKTALVQ